MSYNSRTDHSDTYASVGYLKETGYMIKTDFERYSGRVNYNMNPLTWFKTGINLAMTRSFSNNSTATSSSSSSFGNLTRFVRQMAPIYPIHKHDMETGAYLDANGNPTTDKSQYVYDYDGPRLSVAGRHAIAEQLWNERTYATNTNMGKVYATLMPLEGLEMTVNYSVDAREVRRSTYRNAIVGDGAPGGDLYKYSYRTTSETFSRIINYRRTLGEHNLLVTAGHESYKYAYEYLSGSKRDQTVSGIYEFPNFVDINSLNSYTNNYTKEGYLARLNYDYAARYYASASFRRDGTSRFSKNNRWGNFWSVGASWRVSEEPFMQGVTWVSNLKLRASYGETGVDRILDADDNQDYFPYLS
ncbi:MAG: hypothetical protein LUD68_05910 [Rikenellaceae bacterium]|nr:hypothetical protein [Rikenellaceae bacterium]